MKRIDPMQNDVHDVNVTESKVDSNFGFEGNKLNH
jgi:hypothetical protein